MGQPNPTHGQLSVSYIADIIRSSLLRPVLPCSRATVPPSRSALHAVLGRYLNQPGDERRSLQHDVLERVKWRDRVRTETDKRTDNWPGTGVGRLVGRRGSVQ